MIAQVVVRIRHADAEHDSSPEFFQIPICLGAMGRQKINEVQVTRSRLTVPVSQHCHGRGEMQALPLRGAIEPFGEEGVVPAREPLRFRFGHLDARVFRQIVRGHFPRPDVEPVMGTRKLRDPWVSVVIE